MELLEVTVSGSVGKQTFATAGAPAILKGLALTPSGANATIKIRDGNASGTVVFFGRAPSAQGTLVWDFSGEGKRFDKGMHVKVVGANAVAYLELN